MLQRDCFHWCRICELGVVFCSLVLLVNLVACDRPGAALTRPRVLLQQQQQRRNNVVSTTSALSRSSSPSPGAALQCPLNFTALDKFPYVAQQAANEALDTATRCLALYHGFDVVMSEYLKQTSYFLVPADMAPACVQAYDAQLSTQSGSNMANFSGTQCGFSASYLARGSDHCEHIQTLDDFKRPLSVSVLTAVNNSCSGVLGYGNSRSTLCPACIREMLSMTAALEQQANGSTDGCYNYTLLYVGAVVQPGGPLDPGAVVCLWNILPDSVGTQSSTAVHVVIGATIVVVVSVVAAALVFLHCRHREIKKQMAYVKQTTQMVEGSMRADFTMTWYTLQEIKAATHNFATDRLVGSGAFANVYRGVLEKGTEIAVKRFKNCSPNGDADFVREVETLASVRHKNLVTLRGCCIAKSGQHSVESHQRIIICDFMQNGSLHDYLLRSPDSASRELLQMPERATRILDWATRKKIAIDMARGIDYLHYRVQPQILHRDIKSSNILLNSDFNARVADFGLAKFSPDGMTHMTTRAAGTFGYIAPEYALYGQLTERSDVYSFGVVLLELISGRKALIAAGSAKTSMTTTTTTTADSANFKGDGFTLLTDWANALVKSGKWIEVLDPRMMMKIDNNQSSNDVNLSTLDHELASENLEEMKRFVTVALLCAHPQIAYRPTITYALRILGNEQQEVPELPDRPIPVTLDRNRIKEALGGSSNLLTSQGFQSYATVSSVGSSYMAR